MAKQFEVVPLGYAFNALEPYIDARTMEIHHDKHYGTYTTNLNKALESAPDLTANSVEDILRNLNNVPESIRTAVRNNGGGYSNHGLFWQWIAPGGSKQPTGSIAQEINSAFGGYDAFVDKFSSAATTRFGSGWAWLVRDGSGKLDVYSTANQDSPYMEGKVPLLGLDVWEHAYYLLYQNRRADYIKAFWNVVNWDFVQNRFQNAK